MPVTFDGDVLRSSRLNRSKAERQGLRSVQTRVSEDTTIKSYGEFEVVDLNLKVKRCSGSKIHGIVNELLKLVPNFKDLQVSSVKIKT